jgi:hypothetical protein
MHTDTPNAAISGTAAHTANAPDIHGAVEALTELRAPPTGGDRVEHVSAALEPTERTLSNVKTASADLVLSSTRTIRGRQMPLFDRNAALFDRIAALEADIADPEIDITHLGVDVIAIGVDLATFEADNAAFEADLAAFDAYQDYIAAHEVVSAARREGAANRAAYFAPVLQHWRNRLNAFWGDLPIV